MCRRIFVPIETLTAPRFQISILDFRLQQSPQTKSQSVLNSSTGSALRLPAAGIQAFTKEPLIFPEAVEDLFISLTMRNKRQLTCSPSGVRQFDFEPFIDFAGREIFEPFDQAHAV